MSKKGSCFNKWFEGELAAMPPVVLAIYHQERLRIEMEQSAVWQHRAHLWKQLAKSLRADLNAANDELDALDDADGGLPEEWFV